MVCLRHLLHKCALKIRQEYKQIDKLIYSIKMLIVKHKKRRENFDAIGIVPLHFISRWEKVTPNSRLIYEEFTACD